MTRTTGKLKYLQCTSSQVTHKSAQSSHSLPVMESRPHNPKPRPIPRPHHSRPRPRARPDHSRPSPPLPRPRPLKSETKTETETQYCSCQIFFYTKNITFFTGNIFLHEKPEFFHSGYGNLPRLSAFFMPLFSFFSSVRSCGLDRVVSSETETFEPRDRDP